MGASDHRVTTTEQLNALYGEKPPTAVINPMGVTSWDDNDALDPLFELRCAADPGPRLWLKLMAPDKRAVLRYSASKARIRL